MTEILTLIDGLSLEDKEILFRHLGKDIQMQTCSRDGRIDAITKMVSEIMGVDCIGTLSRGRQYVVARVLLANALLALGLSTSVVGKHMQKDHTTIMHYRDMMKEWQEVPFFYKQELETWKQLNELI